MIGEALKINTTLTFLAIGRDKHIIEKKVFGIMTEKRLTLEQIQKLEEEKLKYYVKH